jgi:hypothetical protein
MPNTTPIPELIAIEIESRLNTILLENNYSFDVSEVVRPNRKGENWQYRHMGIGILQGESTRVPELDCPGNPPAIAYAVQFQLQGICKDSMNLDEPHATSENEMAAAIQKAIASDVNTWHTMDGNAFDSDFGSATPFSSPEGENLGVSIPLSVTYRVSENNPFEVRA